jgi:hypothetical protein
MEEVPDGVLEGYYRGTDMVRGYLEGTAEEMEVFMCD